MANLVVVYWRDIPAQVIARAGRQKAARALSQRFEKAIDSAAMGSGAKDAEAYLEEWRKSDPLPCSLDLEAEVEALAAKLEGEYPADRLRALIRNRGREATQDQAT